VSGDAPADFGVASRHCITCGDDGEPMTVVAVDRERGLALCSSDDGLQATIETALVEPVIAGERLLVHAGTAIARLQPGSGAVAR